MEVIQNMDPWEAITFYFFCFFALASLAAFVIGLIFENKELHEEIRKLEEENEKLERKSSIRLELWHDTEKELSEARQTRRKTQTF